MSDAGRKDFSTKAKESMTPESSKSTTEKISETFTDTTDRAARGAQPDSDKSFGQSMGDKSERMKDDGKHGGTGNTIGDKIQGALGMNK